MNYLALLFIFLFTINGSLAQAQTNQTDSCPDCEMHCLCNFFYPDSILKKQNIVNDITSNWNDFFGENMESIFPVQAGVKTVSIKLDGMGCMYPVSISPNEYSNIKSDFLGKRKEYKDFDSKSFFNLYNTVLKGKGSKAVNSFVNSFRFDPKILKILDYSTHIKHCQEYDYFDFIEKWNAEFLGAKVEEINQIISDNQIKKIIFFIHGYNVPYSLAQKQGNVLADSLLKLDNSLKSENLLFIRVFWPSGNFKHSDFNVNTCNYDNFNRLPTVRLFGYISNRAYLAGITLRTILTEINTDLPLYIITHSHGSTVATTALINTTSKMKPGRTSNSMMKLMLAVDLPDKKVNVFLNAPSIPGQNTFIDLENRYPQTKYKFFVGYNANDQILLKRNIHIGKLKLTLSGRMSSTTLGCNYKNEVRKTQKIFVEQGLEDNFRAGINSFQSQHDFFCYIGQIEFRRNLGIFLSDNLFE